MNLSVQWDIRDLLQAADRMAVQKHLPEFIAKTVAASMRDLAVRLCSWQTATLFFKFQLKQVPFN